MDFSIGLLFLYDDYLLSILALLTEWIIITMPQIRILLKYGFLRSRNLLIASI